MLIPSNILELCGTLILTLVGFIVPLLAILLSLFPQGTRSLTLKYQNEIKQAKENIISETKKIAQEGESDYNQLKSTLKSLERKKLETESKLGYLQPRGLFIKIFFPLAIVFVNILALSLELPTAWAITVILTSLLIFAFGIRALFISVLVLFEVGEMVNQTKNGNEEKVIELLSLLVEKSGEENLYIASKDIKIIFNEEVLKAGATLNFAMNVKYQIPVIISNTSNKMAKNIEVGFVFEKDVLIEETNNLSIYTGELSKTVRFNQKAVQAHEDNIQGGGLSVTFLQPGSKEVTVFAKGENVKYHAFLININVVK